MIVVTGTPRSGTSMIMQIIGMMGIPLTGERFSSVNKREFNPGGYYELPWKTTIKGIQDGRYQGKAVKLFSQELFLTNPKYIAKVISIRRKPVAAIDSLQKLIDANPDYKLEATWDNAEACYDQAWNFGERFFGNNPNIPKIEMEYETVVEYPEISIYILANFLNVRGNLKEIIDYVKSGEGKTCQAQ